MQDKDLNIKAIFGVLSSFFFVASMGLLLQLAHRYEVPVPVMLFIQFTSAFILSFIIQASSKFQHIKTRKIYLHIFRALGGLGAFTLYVLALTKIPLVNATLLQNTAPIFIPFIAYLILKSVFDKNIWLGIAVGFIGIIFIIKPGGSDFTFNIGDVYGLLAGVCLAFVFVILKKLSNTEHYATIIFYFTMISSIILAPFAFLNWVSIPLEAWLLVIGAGFMIIFYQVMIQYAYKFSEPVKLSPFTYSTVIYAGIFDWIFFDHVPDIFTLIGIVIVCIGGILAIKYHGLKHGFGNHSWH
jgi:drug/metabolite transporter (DMT)-like permease